MKYDIGITGRFLRPSMPTGTHRSALRWLEATAPHLKGTALVHCPQSHGASKTLTRFSSLTTRALPFSSSKMDHVWEQGIYPLFSSARVLWSLMGTGPIFHPGKKHVMFVHDINFILLPHVFSISFRRWYHFACARAARQADIVVCFTNYVRTTLVERIGLEEEKIRVIPQGPGLPKLSISRNFVPQKYNYFLCVGSLQPHKNLRAVLLAWREFSQSRVGWKLVIVGRAQSRFEVLTIDSSLTDQTGIEYTGYISDDRLVELYKGAAGFLYPSFEEGFGLPIIEAFFCGCPVVTSNMSCLPEVAGDAAILVDPHNPADLKRAMILLAEQPDERAKFREAGLVRARRFEWERAGKAMAMVLDEAAKL